MGDESNNNIIVLSTQQNVTNKFTSFLLLGRGGKEATGSPPATISKEKGILQKLKEVFWKPEEESEPEGSEGQQRQKMS